LDFYYKDGGNICSFKRSAVITAAAGLIYEGWNFNSGNYLFTTDTK